MGYDGLLLFSKNLNSLELINYQIFLNFLFLSMISKINLYIFHEFEKENKGRRV